MSISQNKKKLIESLGFEKYIHTDIAKLNSGNIISIKYSKIHNSDHYWFTINTKNIENFEKYSVSNFIFFGPIGYYNIPIMLLKDFFSNYPEVPVDGKYHFGTYFGDHILKSTNSNKVDIKEYFNKLKENDFAIKLDFGLNEEPIINYVMTENRNYFAFKTNVASIDDKSPNGTEEFVFEKINWHYDKTKVGDIVFYVQHGDNPSWRPGLSAICEIVKEPYDKGYEGKYYRIKLKPLLILPRVINREEFIGYFNCYNIIFVGPMTKGEPNQANNLMTNSEARNLTGALIDIFPEKEKELLNIFGKDFSTIATKATEGSSKYKTLHDIKIKDISPNPIVGQIKNLILYGAPGTGKSYELNSRIIKYFNHSLLYTRITFHANYSYRNFVGSYKPKPIYTESDKTIYNSDRVTKHIHQKEPIIEYVFEPGPFIIMLERALKNPNHNFLILIEELNRANTASVFGDIFQLLDRNDSGESEYSTTLESSATDYLTSIGVNGSEIKIPSNLYLWSTMNNADQGVLPLDTAFKRRWSFEHLGLNEKEKLRDGTFINFPFLDQENKLEWNKFRKVLNKKLTEMGIHEDKLIGPFFLSKTEIEDSKSVKNKLLLYLKEDILRYKSGIFKNTLGTFSLIAEEYDKGNNVFDVNLKWFE